MTVIKSNTLKISLFNQVVEERTNIQVARIKVDFQIQKKSILLTQIINKHEKPPF